MGRLVSTLDRRLYPDHSERGIHAHFRNRILSRLTPDSVMLDLGAGRGFRPAMDFRGCAARICGVDLDPCVLENPCLDEAKLLDSPTFPYPDATFDVVVSDNVLEHLDDPVVVFREVARVLKPGGLFLAKTPNRWHYVPVLATLTPDAFHKFYNERLGRKAEDTYPTRYRANSARAVRRIAGEAGLEVVEVEHFEGRPDYLRISAPTYVAGWLYERVVNASTLLRGVRLVLIIELRRPENHS
ncbi:MAG: class I SAM-dependent methyltransferase [Fimbriimonadaceae bacterium]|nr:class I SAM-dependent methyltransferase [Chthonomonadaceae bacterium]MCO5298249.1 class I SAM-dependent methyltransferase [Fimbriimonadaceae bacterium]